MMHLQLILIIISFSISLTCTVVAFKLNLTLKSKLLKMVIVFNILFILKILSLTIDNYLLVNLGSLDLNNILLVTVRIFSADLLLIAITVLIIFLINGKLTFFNSVLEIFVIFILSVSSIYVRLNSIELEKYLYSIKSFLFILAIIILLILLIIRYKKSNEKFEKNIYKVSIVIIFCFLPIILFDLVNSIYMSVYGIYGIIELKNDIRAKIMFYPPIILLVLSVLIVIVSFKQYIDSFSNKMSLSNLDELSVLDDFNLTKREQSVVSLIAGGLDNKTIAVELDISVHTVKTYIKRIFQKTGHRSRYEIIANYKNSSINK